MIKTIFTIIDNNNSNKINTITLKDAVDTIESYRGKKENNIISVRFMKKDGSIREMHCKVGYDDGTLVKNPQNKGLDFKAKGLIGVYDIDKNEYRSFRIDSLIEIGIHSKVYNNIDINTLIVWKKIIKS